MKILACHDFMNDTEYLIGCIQEFYSLLLYTPYTKAFLKISAKSNNVMASPIFLCFSLLLCGLNGKNTIM